MTVSDDTTLQYWKEHREQLRQSENQRAALTNYVLIIVAAISGFIVQQRFGLRTLPLSILIIVVGIYGALTCAKYHERADYHLLQARALTKALVDSGALANHNIILEQYRQEHRGKYPMLQRFRLHQLWTGLHIGIMAYGIMLVIITVLS